LRRNKWRVRLEPEPGGRIVSMTVCMRIESKCLHVRVEGRFSLGAAQKAFVDVLEAALRRRVGLILFDARRVTGNPSTIDRFFYAKFTALTVALARQRHGIRNPKFAYVLKAPVLDPKRFGVTVAVNRGMNVQAFETLEEGRQWLGLSKAA
jgi:hypothetical protein